MQLNKYIYSFGYANAESELCKLESKYLFNKEEKDRTLFSAIKVDPSHSAFIKKRVDVILSCEDYSLLVNQVSQAGISTEGFKVEYLVVDGDATDYQDRLEKLREIGYCIEGEPDYYKPRVTYALCYYKKIWYFGIVTKNNLDWYKHKQKPCSNSNSIKTNIAKALVNIATKGDTKNKLIDACCGVGTVILEACFAGYNIEGCDINWKQCRAARENISHFNYNAEVYRSDIKDITKRYDAAIVDLPYNLLSRATDSDIYHIIKSTGEIADRLVVVSTADITNLIGEIGYTILDYCSISKIGKKNFTRNIWICEV